MMAFKPAFKAFDMQALINKINKSIVAPLPTMYSSAFRGLVKSMLRKNPETRPSAADLLKHSHLQPYVHNLNLNLNPPTRRHTYPVHWSDYNYEKKTTFIEQHEPKLVHSHRPQTQTFSSDRALNPSVSEHDLSRSFTKKLSIRGIEEQKPVHATKTPKSTPAKASATPVKQTSPASKQSRTIRKISLSKSNTALSSIESPDVSVNAPLIDKMTEIPFASTEQRCSSDTYATTIDHWSVKIIDQTHAKTAGAGGGGGGSRQVSGQQRRFDTSSYQQRAEALEGLLEFSAHLMQQERIEELEVLLKPFGPEKVSPRETAIWLSKSFKGNGGGVVSSSR